jgi:hypothetical protein
MVILEVMKREGWVKVYAAQGLAEAYVVRGLLESNGIPVELEYEALGPLLGLTLNGLGEVKIMVPSQWEEAARSLLVQSGDEQDGGEMGHIS